MEAEGGRDCRAVQEAALEILGMVRETHTLRAEAEGTRPTGRHGSISLLLKQAFVLLRSARTGFGRHGLQYPLQCAFLLVAIEP